MYVQSNSCSYLVGAVCFPFQKMVLVHEMFEEGAAAKDDRLCPGDEILEVSFIENPHVTITN